ncbi:MAG TPA: ABC transporter substrate-binding protein [Elusimicrobiota bacterium]|jgi:peptide/nickel transport system substrate-binding protein|nr:ABC transporter substrate-binding protein [Elusimicrobiota bacterium]
MNAVLAALLCAAPVQAQVKNPGTFVFGAVAGVTSLDPVYPYDAVSPGVIFNVYETLIAFEGERNDRMVPLLATQVPSRANGLVSADGRTYTFPIRKGVRFQDGSPMTPEDVKYSLLRFMLTDRAGGPSSLLLEPILGAPSTRDDKGALRVSFEEADKAVSVQGDRVVVRLKEPFAPFLSIMARWSYVMSKSWAKANGAWDGDAATWKKFNNPASSEPPFFEKMNGTGPFALERWDRQSGTVYLKRHEGYWRKKAALERALIVPVKEFATRKLMLQAGDADLIEAPRLYLSQMNGLSGVRVADDLPRLMTDPVIFFTFQINPVANPDIGSGKLDGDGVPPDFFQDADVRKAFAYAFDYDGFVKDTFKGAVPRAVSPIPPGLPGYDPKAPHYSFDKAKAEAYFRKAWGGKVWEKGFRFTLTYNQGGDVREYACQILKRGVESINPKFRVDLRGVEWAAFLDKAQKKLMPAFSRGWTADYPDAHNFVFPFYHSQGRYPSAQAFADPELDRMIAAAVRETDPAKRAALYKKVVARGQDLVPHILTVHPRGAYPMRDWVKGFYDNAVFMGIYLYPLSK